MMGVDCDPDRSSLGPLTWSGVQSIKYLLMDLDKGKNGFVVPFALNIRFDNEIKGYYGKADTCLYLLSNDIGWAKGYGCSVGIHYHSTTISGEFVRGPINPYGILSVPKEFKVSVHDGWCDHRNLEFEMRSGFKLNYSPCPEGFGPNYDWRGWPNRPVWMKDMLILPTQTMKTRFGRAYNHINTVHPTAPPYFFRRLVKEFEKTGNDTLCCYFHADEIVGKTGSRLRNFIYDVANLKQNIRWLRNRGYKFENAEDVYKRFRASRDRLSGIQVSD